MLETVSFIFEQVDETLSYRLFIIVYVYSLKHSSSESNICLFGKKMWFGLNCGTVLGFLQALYHNVKPASLKQQLENISVVCDKAEAFSQIWAAAGPDELEKIRQRIFAPQTVRTQTHLSHGLVLVPTYTPISSKTRL